MHKNFYRSYTKEKEWKQGTPMQKKSKHKGIQKEREKQTKEVQD